MNADSSWFEALPAELEREPDFSCELEALRQRLAGKAPPTGRFARFWALSSLPAKLAAAYAYGWLRLHFSAADERERVRVETHWRAALHALGTMGYLRGAVTKVGQLIASYPDLAPRQMLELFATLHCEAPPMHFALISAVLRAELGEDAEGRFSALEHEPFAAASIGQVHRARLADGTELALKIQYPGIARALRADLANARLVCSPLRLGKNWDNLLAQFVELCRGLEAETDYLREALWTERARGALRELDDVVIPRVFPQHSSSRVLATEFLAGQHLDEYLATRPSQEDRDRRGTAIFRASFRLWCEHRLLNSDAGPGNFLFLADGRVGLIDFGSCREYDGEEWELMRSGMRAQREGGALEDECLRRMLALEDLPDRTAALEHGRAAAHWLWEPLRTSGPFDFGSDEYLTRGMRLFGEGARSGHTRQVPVNMWNLRQFYGVRALLWALRARVDAHAITNESYARAGF